MTTVNALSDFGIDLSDAARTPELARRLPECPDSRFELDLSGCILDYPATSAVVDGVIDRLERAPEPRSFVIRFDIPFQERVFEKWLFFESKLLENGYQHLDPETLHAKVNEALRRRSVTLTITVQDPAGNTVAEYRYG